MAAEICNADTLSKGLVEGILEAAGEMKAVRLKVLLARAFEIILDSESNERPADTDDTFLDEVREALK